MSWYRAILGAAPPPEEIVIVLDNSASSVGVVLKTLTGESHWEIDKDNDGNWTTATGSFDGTFYTYSASVTGRTGSQIKFRVAQPNGIWFEVQNGVSGYDSGLNGLQTDSVIYLNSSGITNITSAATLTGVRRVLFVNGLTVNADFSSVSVGDSAVITSAVQPRFNAVSLSGATALTGPGVTGTATNFQAYQIIGPSGSTVTADLSGATDFYTDSLDFRLGTLAFTPPTTGLRATTLYLELTDGSAINPVDYDGLKSGTSCSLTLVAGLSESEVDAWAVRLQSVLLGAGVNSGTINFFGNAAPSPTGEAAIDALRAAGITVIGPY